MSIIDKTKPVMVTGATGYIAGWIVKNLLENGFKVNAAVRDINNIDKKSHLDAIAKKSNGEIINIGLGKPIKIKNVIDKVQKIIKKGKPLYGKLNYKKNTNMKLYPDVTKAKKLLNWQPKIKFSEGLRLTIKSYTK